VKGKRKYRKERGGTERREEVRGKRRKREQQ
jgi:hypothetical protein